MSASRSVIIRLSILGLIGALAFSGSARGRGERGAEEQRSNKAAKVEVTASGFERQVAAKAAPAGQAYFVLETEWTNIHPKQKVNKDQLEGKQDRTIGVGGLRPAERRRRRSSMWTPTSPTSCPRSSTTPTSSPTAPATPSTR